MSFRLLRRTINGNAVRTRRLLVATVVGTANLPSRPTVVLVAGNGKIEVDWSVDDDGGSKVTGYTVTPGGGALPSKIIPVIDYDSANGDPVPAQSTTIAEPNGTPVTVTVTVRTVGCPSGITSDPTAATPLAGALPGGPLQPPSAMFPSEATTGINSPYSVLGPIARGDLTYISPPTAGSTLGSGIASSGDVPNPNDIRNTRFKAYHFGDAGDHKFTDVQFEGTSSGAAHFGTTSSVFPSQRGDLTITINVNLDSPFPPVRVTPDPKNAGQYIGDPLVETARKGGASSEVRILNDEKKLSNSPEVIYLCRELNADGTVAYDRVKPANAVAVLSVVGSTSGSFTLSYGGQTTAGLAYTASAAQVAAALTTIGATVTATGGPANTTAVTLTFAPEGTATLTAALRFPTLNPGTVNGLNPSLAPYATYPLANLQLLTIADPTRSTADATDGLLIVTTSPDGANNGGTCTLPAGQTLAQYNLANGTRMSARSDTGTGLDASTTYYLVNPGSSTFQLSATDPRTAGGGNPVPLTAAMFNPRTRQFGLQYHHSHGDRNVFQQALVSSTPALQVLLNRNATPSGPVKPNDSLGAVSMMLDGVCSYQFAGQVGLIDNPSGMRAVNTSFAWGYDGWHGGGDNFLAYCKFAPTKGAGHNDTIQFAAGTGNDPDGDIWLDIGSLMTSRWSSYKQWAPGEIVAAGDTRWYQQNTGSQTNRVYGPIQRLRSRLPHTCSATFDTVEAGLWESDGVYRQGWAGDTAYLQGQVRVVDVGQRPELDWPVLCVCNADYRSSSMWSATDAAHWTRIPSEKLLHMPGRTWTGVIAPTIEGYSSSGGSTLNVNGYSSVHNGFFIASNTDSTGTVQNLLIYGGYHDNSQSGWVGDNSGPNGDNFRPYGGPAQVKNWPTFRGQSGGQRIALLGKIYFQTTTSPQALVVGQLAQSALGGAVNADDQLTTVEPLVDSTPYLLDGPGYGGGTLEQVVTDNLGSDSLSTDAASFYVTGLTVPLKYSHAAGAKLHTAALSNAGQTVPHLSVTDLPSGVNTPMISTGVYKYLTTGPLAKGAGTAQNPVNLVSATVVSVSTDDRTSSAPVAPPGTPLPLHPPYQGAPWSPIPPVGSIFGFYDLKLGNQEFGAVVKTATQRDDGSFDIVFVSPLKNVHADVEKGTSLFVATPVHPPTLPVQEALTNWRDIGESTVRSYDWTDELVSPALSHKGMIVSWPGRHRMSLADTFRQSSDRGWGTTYLDTAGVSHPTGLPGWPLPQQKAGNWTHLAYRARAGAGAGTGSPGGPTGPLITFEQVTVQAMWIGDGMLQEQKTVVSSVPWNVGAGSPAPAPPDGGPLLSVDPAGQVYSPHSSPNYPDEPLYLTRLSSGLSRAYRRGLPVNIVAGLT